MAIRFARRNSNPERAFLWGGACLLVYASALGQVGRPRQDPSASQKSQGSAVVGCFSGTPGAFQLSDSEGYLYRLTGRTSGLEKCAGAEISIQGTKDESAQTLEVSSFKEIFRAPGPKLSSSFNNRSNWSTQTNRKFGVKFALPRFANSTAAFESDTNFAIEQGMVTLAELDIPSEIYPHTNFIGGSFAISVNPQITNRQSCEQFGEQFGAVDQGSLSSRTISGIRYAERTSSDSGMGKLGSVYYFHSFQNTLCYELSFRLLSSNPEFLNLSCAVSVVGKKDYLNVVEGLAGRVSFFRPTTENTGVLKPDSVPNVAVKP